MMKAFICLLCLTIASGFAMVPEPTVLRADFNGDGLEDEAFWVTDEGPEGEQYIRIRHGGSGEVHHVAADFAKGNSEPDFSWADGWSVYNKTTTEETIVDANGDIAGSKTVALAHPSIRLEYEEGGTGVISYLNQSYRYIHGSC